MLQALSVLLLRPRPVCHLQSPVALDSGGMNVGPDGNVVIEISPDGSVVQVERAREFLLERCEFFWEEARQRREAQLGEADLRHRAQLDELERECESRSRDLEMQYEQQRQQLEQRLCSQRRQLKQQYQQ